MLPSFLLRFLFPFSVFHECPITGSGDSISSPISITRRCSIRCGVSLAVSLGQRPTIESTMHAVQHNHLVVRRDALCVTSAS